MEGRFLQSDGQMALFLMRPSVLDNNTPQSFCIIELVDKFQWLSKPRRGANIVSFLRHKTDATADIMPFKREQHLPIFQKKTSPKYLLRTLKALFMGKAEEARFPKVWRKNCIQIESRNISRFPLWGTCQELQVDWPRLIIEGLYTELLFKKAGANNIVVCEQREYLKRRGCASIDPLKFFLF